jgi:hypothetical protein
VRSGKRYLRGLKKARKEGKMKKKRQKQIVKEIQERYVPELLWVILPLSIAVETNSSLSSGLQNRRPIHIARIAAPQPPETGQNGI